MYSYRVTKRSFSYKRHPDFNVLGGKHERSVKHYCPGNIPHQWRFQ